ncbi:MAG TPA: rRNA maturation RNase YbeY [Anaerolineaceae bacterium]
MIEFQIRENAGMPGLGTVARRAAAAALAHEGQPDTVEMTVVLTGDQEIQALNKQFLGNDAPTDVLSFPSGETDPESGAVYLGDMIISVERAKLQAMVAGHSLAAEIELLVVHGVLHLLGYDHGEEGEKRRMWSAQAHILESIGNPIRDPAE